MAFQFNGTNIQTVYMNGTEARTVVMNGTTVYVKVYVTFNEQGGSAVSDKYVYYQDTYGTLPTPTRSGYTFNGWFTQTLGNGAQITNSTLVTTTSENQTLYAYWVSTAVPTATPTIVSWNYFNAWYINIRNNDNLSADIRSEAYDSTPDIYRGVANPFSTLQVFDNSQPGFATFTYYATATATNGSKTVSSVTSRTIT